MTHDLRGHVEYLLYITLQPEYKYADYFSAVKCYPIELIKQEVVEQVQEWLPWSAC